MTTLAASVTARKTAVSLQCSLEVGFDFERVSRLGLGCVRQPHPMLFPRTYSDVLAPDVLSNSEDSR